MQPSPIARDFTHLPLEHEIQAIGGHYVFTRELRMPYAGREILCLVGYGVVDTSCCGVGGCGFALVPGFILDWKYASTEDGSAISRVEPIEAEGLRQTLTRLIMQSEVVNQVKFHEWYKDA